MIPFHAELSYVLFSSVPNLYPPDASSTFPLVMPTKKKISTEIAKCPFLGGTKFPLVEKSLMQTEYMMFLGKWYVTDIFFSSRGEMHIDSFPYSMRLLFIFLMEKKNHKNIIQTVVFSTQWINIFYVSLSRGISTANFVFFFLLFSPSQ